MNADKKNPSIKIKERRGNPRTGNITLPETITPIKQPNTLTKAVYDYSLLQLRALIIILERLQPAIEQSINKEEPTQLALFQNPDPEKSHEIALQVPMKAFGVHSGNYGQIKRALSELAMAKVELAAKDPFTGDDSWLIQGLCKVHIPQDKRGRSVTIVMDKEVARALVNTDGGFTKYVKEIAFNAQSKYTIKMYFLISSWKSKGGFEILMPKFRKQFAVEDKYLEYKDLYKRVIRPCYEELFEKSDVWFEMSEEYEGDSKEPKKLKFKVIQGKLSKQDELKLGNSKNSMRAMLFNHLGLKDDTIEAIVGYVNIHNCSHALEKTAEVITYIKEHRSTIQDEGSYALVSIRSALGAEISGVEAE